MSNIEKAADATIERVNSIDRAKNVSTITMHLELH